jgi:hypothetical protein
MKCPKCIEATQVLETRQTRRRRECLTCGFRFTTLEVLATEAAAPQPEPRPVPKPKPAPAKINIKARAEARRIIEERRDRARLDRGDYYSSDNDYLPEI